MPVAKIGTYEPVITAVGRLISILTIMPFIIPDNGRTASINRLAISPAQQGKGLGKALIAELENKLKQKGIKKLAIMIHVGNTQVIPFYEKLGFKEMDYVKMYYKDF